MGENMNILIMDDEEDICLYGKEYLEKRGFNVFTAVNEKEARKIIDNEKIHIAILDLYIDGNKTGIDILKIIKEIKPECQCVMVTVEDKEEAMEEAKRFGIKEYLTKPITVKELEEVVLKVSKGREGA